MKHYAISPDGHRVVFVVSGDTGRSPVWVANLDGFSAPRQVTRNDAWKAYFAAAGYVVFAGEREKAVYRVKEDGSDLQKLMRIESPSPLFSISPDGKWLIIPESTDSQRWQAMVYPVGGGTSRLLCVGCSASNDVERVRPSGVSWSPDGKFLYLNFRESISAIPLRLGEMLPPIPAAGFRSNEDVAVLPGVRLIPELGAFPGPEPSVYAFTKVVTQRNIYRVRVP
jgi:Tol biopolymer transport system component